MNSTVIVNGQPVDCTADTLAALCEELGYGSARIATAVNGAFVPAGARAQTRVRDADRIEIVAPRQGG